MRPVALRLKDWHTMKVQTERHRLSSLSGRMLPVLPPPDRRSRTPSCTPSRTESRTSRHSRWRTPPPPPSGSPRCTGSGTQCCTPQSPPCWVSITNVPLVTWEAVLLFIEMRKTGGSNRKLDLYFFYFSVISQTFIYTLLVLLSSSQHWFSPR